MDPAEAYRIATESANIYKWLCFDSRESFIIKRAQQILKLHNSPVLGYRSKKNEIDTGYFYCPYIPKLYNDATPVRHPRDSKLSVLRQRDADHRLGWTGHSNDHG